MQHTLYIRDSSDFINNIELLKPNKEILLVSYDISSLYTNMTFEELLSAVEQAYNTVDKSIYNIPAPSTKDILYLLKLVLENNIFEFNKNIYRQVIGCANGL